MINNILSLFVAPIIVGVVLLLIERFLNTHNNKKK